MSRIYVETDLIAHDVGQHLATARYAIAAARGGAELDYSFGLRAALTARVLSSLVLDNLDNEKTDDCIRFRDFSREAMKLQDDFWTVFKLVVLVNVNGSSRMVQAQPIEPPKPVVKRKQIGGRNRYGSAGLPIDIRDSIIRDAFAIPGGVDIGDWHTTVAERYGVSRQTVERYYYKHKNGSK